jgi:hypothetical protein
MSGKPNKYSSQELLPGARISLPPVINILVNQNIKSFLENLKI